MQAVSVLKTGICAFVNPLRPDVVDVRRQNLGCPPMDVG
jgi:hypothetical protein